MSGLACGAGASCSLPEVRGERVCEGLPWIQGLGFSDQGLFGLHMGGISDAGVDRAHGSALRLFVEAHAFGAFLDVDLVNVRAHADRRIRALRLARTTIIAIS